MPDSEEMNPVLLQVERINDSIVADASGNGSILSADDAETMRDANRFHQSSLQRAPEELVAA
jgi:hypothetical protein